MAESNTRFYDNGSDLWYGDFDAMGYLRIEEDEHYNSILKHNGIKNTDCVLIRIDGDMQKIIFIEGKKKLPFRRKGFDNDISDIAMQFADSLHLICGSWLTNAKIGVALPGSFSTFFQRGGQIIFALVVKNAPIEELHLLQLALERRLKKEQHIWKVEIEAYNEDLAIQKNLVVKGETP